MFLFSRFYHLDRNQLDLLTRSQSHRITADGTKTSKDGPKSAKRVKFKMLVDKGAFDDLHSLGLFKEKSVY